MIIIKEATKLDEILEPAGKTQLQILQDQMERNPELKKTLTTPIWKLPQYKYLVSGEIARQLSLFQGMKLIIDEYPDTKPYFIKTTKGLYVGFIGILLEEWEGRTIVNNVKAFSFGLSPAEDENMIQKDMPNLLDKCLKQYPIVRWVAMKTNKACRSYDIYCKRHKGVRQDHDSEKHFPDIERINNSSEKPIVSDSWEYICFK